PILAAMKRKYDAEKVGWALNWINERFPEAFIGLDVITGFPGETDELFQQTYENLKKWPWTRIHVFPYSERSGTRAAIMEGSVPVHVRKERAKILRELSFERYDEKATEQVGSVKQVISLRSPENYVKSLSHDYWDVMLKNISDVPSGTELEVKITGYERSQKDRLNGFLVGELQNA
ncbi:MAG: tRNA (N(6)-L-threonylcarbamoyladenosine(37)-C(2))-methylthiotransferase MtaB, partial [Bdellovibrionales bacterium]|nr:tRNA (N(6)-L-threonylcarbamoyladenosine(37)-C(2))-methylthiotransferase MtaB [Bdellovibrionales bacterium]